MPGNDHQISFERRDGQWLAGGRPAQEHVIRFDKGSGPHKVKFHVGTPTGRYIFNEEDPIWIKEDDGNCPEEKCSHEDISVKQCGPTMLMIENKNQSAGKFRYQLNVYDTHQDEYCPVDPIMENGGHG
jgi:hypothetical protein